MLDLGRLIVLREIKLQGSLTAAAQSLKVSVSAVSQQVNKLERELGTPLLQRQGRRVTLSSAAQRLVHGTEEALAALETAESEVRGRQGRDRVVRLAAFHSFQLELLEPLLRRVGEVDSELRVEAVDLEPADALVEVSSRRADIAIVDEYSGIPLKPTPGLVTDLIASEPMAVYFPRSYEKRLHAGPIAAAATVPWAMEGVGTESFRWARNVCRSLGFEPSVSFTSPDFHVHARLVRAGHAAAIIPLSVAASETEKDELRPAMGFPTDLTRQIYAVVRRGTRQRHDIEVVIGALKEAYDGIISQAPRPLPDSAGSSN